MGCSGDAQHARWRYTDAETGEYVYIWTPGRVVRVADGLCDKRSKQGKKLLPAGAVLWGWEADDEFKEQAGEQWLTLLPAKYNQQVWYGWRYDPRELVPAPAEHPEAAPTPGARREGQSQLLRGNGGARGQKGPKSVKT